jgi:hypothetical protein
VCSLNFGPLVRDEVLSAAPQTRRLLAIGHLVQVYTAGLDGVILLWDYESSKVEAKWHIQHPIESMVITGRHAAAVSIHWSERDTGRIALLNFSGEAALKRAPDSKQFNAPSEAIVCKLQRPGALSVSPSKEFVAAVDGPRLVVVCLQHNRALLSLLHTRPLTVRPCAEEAALRRQPSSPPLNMCFLDISFTPLDHPTTRVSPVALACTTRICTCTIPHLCKTIMLSEMHV